MPAGYCKHVLPCCMTRVSGVLGDEFCCWLASLERAIKFQAGGSREGFPRFCDQANGEGGRCCCYGLEHREDDKLESECNDGPALL